MKVFISWSGKKSHKVALVFHEWLPLIIESIVPYVSSEDINKGARWSTGIATELEESNYGILCVTKESIDAPWLSFEAGALSKTIDKSHVSPFLFDIKRSEINNNPILQFQSTIFKKEDLKKLVQSLNNARSDTAMSDNRLNTVFEKFYPDLADKLNELKELPNTDLKQDKTKESLYSSKILEEILELTRTNQKILRSPEILLPSKYLDTVIGPSPTVFDELKAKSNYLTLEINHRFNQIKKIIQIYKQEERLIDHELESEIFNLIDFVKKNYPNQ